MSIRIMSAVFDNEVLAATPRLILLALADHADDAGHCYPSIERLCKRTGLKERAVQTNVRKLCEDGYLKVDVGGGRKNCNLYQISLPKLQEETPHEMHPARNAPPHMTTKTPHMTTENPARDAPEPSGTIKEPSVPPVGPPPKKPKRAVALPENWVPNEANIDHAISKQFTIQEIQHEAERFKNHHLARGSTFKCWDAAWRTWIGNAIRFGRRQTDHHSRTNGAGGYGSGTVAAFAAVAERLQEGSSGGDAF